MFIPKLYNDQLLYSFYLKRGKTLAFPHILYCINRLLDLYPKKKMRILDVGCNDGAFLKIIYTIAKSNGFAKNIELYGLDVNESSLEKARAMRDVPAKYINHDLCDGDIQTEEKFDIIVSINTLHEVYSVFLKDGVDVAREKVSIAYEHLTDLLSEHGTYIVYDGVDVDSKIANKCVQFRMNSSIGDSLLKKIIDEYKAYPLTCEEISSRTYSMKYKDLSRVLTLLKYVDTPLWDIESTQSYQYFNKKEFISMFERLGFVIESTIVINSDLGLWKDYVEILSKDVDYPEKSIVIVASKGYPSSLSSYDTTHVIQFQQL